MYIYIKQSLSIYNYPTINKIHSGVFMGHPYLKVIHDCGLWMTFLEMTGFSDEHPGLISFRMGWLDLLAVQGTVKSLLQHHSSKASVLRCSAFFTVELSHPYTTTGKTIALTRRTFVGKVMSLLLNMLSRFIKLANAFSYILKIHDSSVHIHLLLLLPPLV